MTIFESIDEDLYYARNSVNTNPTDGQKKAGNYKKGHVTINGYKISIENPKGSVRRGKDRNGHEWSITMAHDYGYFVKKTKGKDGDPIDVFIGDDLESEKIFVVDQKVGGKFDESKVMFCFDSEEKAKQGYLDCYAEDWKGFWKITPVSQETFRKWLYDGYRQRKPFFQYVEIIKSNKKEKENMKKKQIRLTESGLRQIVKESVNKILNEVYGKGSKYTYKTEDGDMANCEFVTSTFEGGYPYSVGLIDHNKKEVYPCHGYHYPNRCANGLMKTALSLGYTYVDSEMPLQMNKTLLK